MAKTRVIDTFSGAEVADLNGALFMMDKVGNKNIIVVDIGVKTTSVGVIKDGICEIEVNPVIAGLSVDLSRPAVRTLNFGGNSIVSVDGKGTLIVGPESIDQDGADPTVTDAKIVLGYDLTIDCYNKTKDQAHMAIEEKIAKKLRISKKEAALKIIEAVEYRISESIKEILSAKNYKAKEFDIYVVGEAGASHCCGIAKHVGAKRAVIFPFGSVFSAFGVTTMDVAYEYRAPVSKKDKIDDVIKSLKTAATIDFKYEGFSEKDLIYLPGFVVKNGNDSEMLVQVGSANLQKEADKISANKQDIIAVMLGVKSSAGKVSLEKQKGTKATKFANNEKREVSFSEGTHQAEICSYQSLTTGSTVAGPAILNLSGSSLVLPKGYELSIDAYRNGIIQWKS